MMSNIISNLNPIKLDGDWKEGYSLDFHTISSEFLGVDEQGYNQFNTLRSELGQLVYDLKYRQDTTAPERMIHLIQPFLNKWGIKSKIDAIIPVPPSNKLRNIQPVYEICNVISSNLDVPVHIGFLEKTNNSESKNQKDKISGSIIAKKHFIIKDINVLLIDDLYQSGITLKESVSILKSDPNIKDIYVLTMTKTKR